MSRSFPLHVIGGKLPLNFEPSPAQLYAATVPRLKAKVTSDDIILGSTADGEPGYNAGPWFNDYSWRFWSDATLQYVATLGILSAPFTLTATSSPTANRTQYLQSKSGTIALLLDTYVPRAVVLPDTGPTIAIDGSLGDSFLARLSEDATITLSNLSESKKITICLINNGTDYTVTWPATVRWDGTAPTQPVADAGNAATGVYVIRKTDSVISVRSAADGISTIGDPTYTTVADRFSAVDAGKSISGTNIPSGTFIQTYTDPKNVEMSQNATANGSSLSFTISYDTFGEVVGSFTASNSTAITTAPGGPGSVPATYGIPVGPGGNVAMP